MLVKMSDQCTQEGQIFACKGRRSSTVEAKEMPSNCNNLRVIGHRLSGFYLVKDDVQIKTVYCDFRDGDECNFNIFIDLKIFVKE